jgi:hemoglobin
MSTIPSPFEVTEAQIADLVNNFYAQARAHPDLGPLFESTVHDWDGHLLTVRHFWSHVLLGTDRYKGHPYPVHMNLGIQRQHFEHWLSLFKATALATLPADAAGLAIGKAEHMAQSFKAGLFPFDKV